MLMEYLTILVIALHCIIEHYIFSEVITMKYRKWGRQLLAQQEEIIAYEQEEPMVLCQAFTEECTMPEPIQAQVSEWDDKTEAFFKELQNELFEDVLLVEDINDNTTNPGPFYESVKIADGLLGSQQWIVGVIGMEQNYIHVSDGNRTWLNVGEYIKHINMGDILAIDVVRHDASNITVEKVNLLERLSAGGYMNQDENYEDDILVAI